MNFDWDDIRLFQKVGETGSFSKAAKALGTSQPTLSRRMQKMQSRLNVILFERNERGLVLSRHGQVLYDLAIEMVKNAEAFELAATSLRKDIQIVRVACSPLIGLALGTQMAMLTQDLDQVRVALLTSVDFANLDKGEADIALRNQRPQKGNLLSQKLGMNHFGIFASPEVAKECQTLVENAQWQECRWVGYAQSMSHMPTNKWLMKNTGVLEADVQFESSLHILSAVRHGMGLAVLPTYIGRLENLTPLLSPLKDLVFESWIVSHEQSAHNKTVNLVKQRLSNIIKKMLSD